MVNYLKQKFLARSTTQYNEVLGDYGSVPCVYTLSPEEAKACARLYVQEILEELYRGTPATAVLGAMQLTSCHLLSVDQLTGELAKDTFIDKIKKFKDEYYSAIEEPLNIKGAHWEQLMDLMNQWEQNSDSDDFAGTENQNGSTSSTVDTATTKRGSKESTNQAIKILIEFFLSIEF